MRRRDGNFPDNGFEAWGGYMQAKITKLEDQFSDRAKKEGVVSNIFHGVCIYVNGFTIPSADEIKVLMRKHGGIYHTYQRSDDFVIASNLPDTKVKNMNLAKVVKPEWITESLAANQLLDYRKFLLYTNSRNQKQLNFRKVFKSNNSTDVTTDTLCRTEIDCISNETSEEKKENSLLENQSAEPCTSSKSVLEINNVSSNYTVINKPISNQNVGSITKTAADPNFISEFYNNSRLHHISQLGACFKQHINDLRESSNFLFPARADLKEKGLQLKTFGDFSQLKFEKNKVIMHIDMDCFFVSVGLRNRPDLKGKPVAVTHSKGGQGRSKRPGVDRTIEFNLYKERQVKKSAKAIGIQSNEVIFESRVDNITEEDEKYGSMSEIASCSYEARAKGIGNGMFMGSALRLCPDLQTIPYDFDGYKEVAYMLYNTIVQYTLNIEAVSCDEMYVDCTELLADLNINVQSFATILRDEIKSKTGCPCSTGFGGNRLQARLATKKAKPDGQFFLTEDLIEDFIFNIKLSDLPGVGRQTAQKLESLGHVTCGSLQSLTLATLRSQFGNKTGGQLFDQCRAKDPNPLTFQTIRKSVSAEVNYGIRFENNDQCIDFLKQLSAEVHSRMEQLKVSGKCVTLKLMVRAEDAPVETAKFMGHGFCNVINKSISLNYATNNLEVITKEVISLCKKQKVDPREMRGIGIQITKLESLNSKPTVGEINKYLCNRKEALQDIKNETGVVIKTEASNLKLENKNCNPIESKIAISPNIKSEAVPIKSPIIKKRGRPSKSLKLQQASKNLMSKYLQVQNNFKELPYRDPMIKEYDEKSQLKTEETEATVTPTSKGLLGLPWDKVRDMLRAWLENNEPPLQCDVKMIVDYLQEMVINRNIENLYVLMNFMRRRTREMENVTWLEVFDNITEQVQNAMIAVYGKKLFVAK